MSSIATRDDVRYAYRLLLGREPDEAGLAHHCAAIENGDVDVTDLASGFLRSAEFVARFGRLVAPAAAGAPPNAAPLRCCACTRRQIDSPSFRYWAARMGLKPGGLHRKAWEWCFIAQALHERGLLRPGSRGLGFAVGQEPLTSLFAGMGCRITATDLDFARASSEGWVEGRQHAAGIEQINLAGLCSPELFAANVDFGVVDMRDVPATLQGYDFAWSSCALEHLGSLRHGLDFVLASLGCLRPGGVAVHTTEFNVESDVRTLETGHDVIFRKRDLMQLSGELRERGHTIEPFDFDLGDSDADRYVDEPPYASRVHLKLRIGGFASTSFGLIVTKGRE